MMMMMMMMIIIIIIIIIIITTFAAASEQRYCVTRRHAVRVCLCVRRAAYITYRLHAALVSAAKVMRCIQCSLVIISSNVSITNACDLPSSVECWHAQVSGACDALGR